jgi:hypothetical protein
LCCYAADEVELPPLPAALVDRGEARIVANLAKLLELLLPESFSAISINPLANGLQPFPLAFRRRTEVSVAISTSIA